MEKKKRKGKGRIGSVEKNEIGNKRQEKRKSRREIDDWSNRKQKRNNAKVEEKEGGLITILRKESGRKRRK